MALSGLDIYKLLPKTNCRECGFATCLAFAMQLAKKAVAIDKCPYVSEESKKVLEESSLPPIRLVTVGVDKSKLEVGNENVLFRHEEKFFHPTGIGFIIDDDLADQEIKKKLSEINQLKFERVGQLLEVNLVALRQKADKKRFVAALKLILANTELSLVLMAKDVEAQTEALELSKDRRPLLYPLGDKDSAAFAQAALKYKTPLVVSADTLDELSKITKDLNSKGLYDLVLEVKTKSLSQRIWDSTAIRRLALKRGERSLGFPLITVVEDDDPYEEVVQAATSILKYASIVLMQGTESWQVLSLLTLRQNIYTDPQKPLQIEPKIYNVGQVNKDSPLLATTNFSLTYYTVLGEVEASKVPSYILSVDTEGMSVLTAWAAEKFTAEKIAEALEKSAVKDLVSHNNLIIPGYVAVLSGDLEEKSGRKVIVGPKEAAGIPSFLKNL
jgi:acetyl-CoA decarbonylase/synthase complex subunit gamma